MNSWKRDVQKVKRAKRESYTSMTSGKMMPESKQGTDCKCDRVFEKAFSRGKNEILTAFNALRIKKNKIHIYQV